MFKDLTEEITVLAAKRGLTVHGMLPQLLDIIVADWRKHGKTDEELIEHIKKVQAIEVPNDKVSG